ncbi:MAG TPA: hypothetical protein VFU46_10965 [Gemmatimonadales bacterium]|nr:hypothetical protein [Gemmatimonadales bacterium]
MSDTRPVRVMVHDVWDEVVLELPGSAPIGEVKRLALERARVVRDPAGYLVKYRGAEVRDESRTLLEEGIVPNAPLIVLARRRRPVR